MSSAQVCSSVMATSILALDGTKVTTPITPNSDATALTVAYACQTLMHASCIPKLRHRVRRAQVLLEQQGSLLIGSGCRCNSA